MHLFCSFFHWLHQPNRKSYPCACIVTTMAIYGLGAYYQQDVTSEFLSNEIACVGWDITDAPALCNMMAHIKVGDIIYIKSHPIDQGLIIKAVGVVVDDEDISTSLGEVCLRVKWIWVGRKELGKIRDKYNVRNNTLYEEHNPSVQRVVVGLLTSECTR